MAWILAIISAVTILFLHDVVLRQISRRSYQKYPMLVVMLVLTMSHIIHIWIYAFIIYAAQKWFKVGEIVLGSLKEECACDSIRDYVYFSAANYTSLGYGDYVATDGLRLIATTEGLIGLLAIGWSTAFAFWWMQKHLLK